MAPLRQGLRARKKPPEKEKKTPAQRSREWRAKLKADSVRYELVKQKDQERNRKNRQLPVSDEEAERRRERARIRQQQCRDRKNAAKLAAEKKEAWSSDKPTTRATMQQEEAAVKLKREKWRKEKQEQRKQWSAQKRRQHRAKALKYYYRKKGRNTGSALPTGEEQNVDLEPSTPSTPCQGKEGQRKAIYRAKKSVLKVHSGLWGKLYKDITEAALKSPRKRAAVESIQLQDEGSNAKQIALNVKAKLAELKKRRSKKCLASRRLLLGVLGDREGSKEVPAQELYRRKKLATKETVVKFFEDVAIYLPGKKTVCKKTLRQKKVLPKRVKRLLKDFRLQFPMLKVSRASFYRYLPVHIMTPSKQSFRQCLCEICQSIELKLLVLNKYLENSFEGRDELCEASLCEEATIQCHNRECSHCGTHKVKSLIFSNITVSKEHFVKWKGWETIMRGNHRRMELLEKETTLESLIELLLKELQKFSSHLFVSRWQYAQFRTCLSVLPVASTMAVAVFDFAENYLCRYQDEVQAAHWGYNQVTVHPVVAHYQCRHCPEVVRDYLLFLSDDLQHDAAMVKTILEKTVDHLAQHLNLDKLVVFSDGCACQYKSKLPWFHLAKRSGPVAVEWAYFGSRHGKSPCDACGGVIKRIVDEDVMAREAVVKDAFSMHEHLTNHYSLPADSETEDTCCHKRRKFFLVNTQEIDRSMPSSALQTYKGTQQIHSVRGLGRNTLDITTRKLSCFCQACLAQQPECEQSAFVDDWKQDTLKMHPAFSLTSSPPDVTTAPPLTMTTAAVSPLSSTLAPTMTTAAASPLSSTSAPTMTTAAASPLSSTSAPTMTTAAASPLSSTSVPTMTTAAASPLSSTSAPTMTTAAASPLSSTSAAAVPQAGPSEPPSQEPRATAPPSELPPDRLPSLPKETKLVFFRRLHAELRRSKTFAELQGIISKNLDAFKLYPLPAIPPVRTVVDVMGTVDKHALPLRPDTVPKHFFPVVTGADGNCLMRCLSLFAYGKESLHQEMRCRVVVDLVLNFDSYAAGVGMAKEGETAEDIVKLLAVVADNSGSILETVTIEDVKEILSGEIMQVRQMSVFCGLWQIAAAANVLRTNICSFYPHKGWPEYVVLNNRTLSPLESSASSTVHILWTSTRDDLCDDNWTSNHFVSLLPLVDPDAPVHDIDGGFEAFNRFEDTEVTVTDFFHVVWQEKDYIARVDSKCDSFVNLSFMEQCRNGLFVWPLVPDTSFEHVRVLRERAQLTLVEELSSQRKLFYKVI